MSGSRLLCAVLISTALTHANVGHADYTYYHNNVLGSPVAATNAEGNRIWRAFYRPFGTRNQHPASYMASLDNPLWFGGHVHDPVTSLNYMLARYYEPTVGRFLSMDPAPVRDIDPQTFNRYSYARNNPYRFIDPDGRESLIFSVRGAASAGGGLNSGAGIYVTFPLTDNVPLDVGYLVSGSVVAGADVSLVANLSLMAGGRENLEGAHVAAGATLPLTGLVGPAVDAEVIINPETGELAGTSVGVGVSAFPTASVSAGKSKIVFSLRDFLGLGRTDRDADSADTAEPVIEPSDGDPDYLKFIY